MFSGARASLRWYVLPLIVALSLPVFSFPASATDNIGAKWHWAFGYVYYRVAAYTLPANFQPAIDNAATKWTNQTAIDLIKGADIGNTNWSDESTHIVWYGSFPSSWGCPSSLIGCTFVQGTDTVNRHLLDVDTVYKSGENYTNTCPWLPGAPYDIETVALHEFGHWGTMNESNDSGAVMWGSY